MTSTTPADLIDRAAGAARSITDSPGTHTAADDLWDTHVARSARRAKNLRRNAAIAGGGILLSSAALAAVGPEPVFNAAREVFAAVGLYEPTPEPTPEPLEAAIAEPERDSTAAEPQYTIEAPDAEPAREPARRDGVGIADAPLQSFAARRKRADAPVPVLDGFAEKGIQSTTLRYPEGDRVTAEGAYEMGTYIVNHLDESKTSYKIRIGNKPKDEKFMFSFDLADNGELELQFTDWNEPFDGAMQINAYVYEVRFEPAKLAGDLDGDGDVDNADVARMALEFGSVCEDCAADINGDGRVDLLDLSSQIEQIGEEAPEPRVEQRDPPAAEPSKNDN
ncbi:MAG: hypothetical protein AAGI17_10610 [Planctomycetota bacterium]